MKIAFLALLLLAASSLAKAEPRSATLHIEKISCPICAAQVKKALNGVAGVKAVAVDVERKQAVVRFDDAHAKAEDLAAATAKHGFPAAIRKVEPPAS